MYRVHTCPPGNVNVKVLLEKATWPKHRESCQADDILYGRLMTLSEKAKSSKYRPQSTWRVHFTNIAKTYSSYTLFLPQRVYTWYLSV